MRCNQRTISLSRHGFGKLLSLILLGLIEIQVITWSTGLHFMFVHGWGGDTSMDLSNGNEMMLWYVIHLCPSLHSNFTFSTIGTVLLS
jgi:hypothetical protein